MFLMSANQNLIIFFFFFLFFSFFFWGEVVCFSNPTSPPWSPFGSVPCVPAYTLSSHAFKEVTRGMDYIVFVWSQYDGANIVGGDLSRSNRQDLDITLYNSI